MDNTVNSSIKGEKLYDLSMINQMCRGNQEMVNKMITVFVTQLPEAVEEIKKAFGEMDLVQIKNTVHRIKPTFTYYGTTRLERKIIQLEAIATEGAVTIEMGAIIMELDEIVNRVVDQLKQTFSN